MARISQLEAQLNAALKINEAAAKQPPIDSEVLKKDAAARIQLEEKVSSLEKENKNLSSKIKQMTLDHGYEKDERVELNKKIEELQHSLDNEIKLNLDLQEAVESKRQLEKDIASLKTDIDNEKTTAKKVSEALAEVFKDKALLELEVGQTRRQLKDQVVADEEAEKQFVSVKSQLEVEIKHRAEAEKECDTLRLEVSELKTRLEESNDSAEYLERTVKTLQDTNADIERERAMISVELSTTMQKLKDVAAEKERQISKIVEEKKQGELESIESLKSELENSNSKIHSLSEEISQLTKEKAVLELGKTEISKKLAAESSAVADIKSKLQAAERRTVDQDQKIQQITESSTKTGNKATQLQTELNSLMQQLRDARANLSITSLKLGSMEKSNTMLQTDLSDMKTKYIAEVNLGADLQIKVKELELSLTNERKTRIQAESTARSTENEKKDIKSAVQRLQARVLVLKDECTAALQQQQAAEARLHAVEAQLEAQISTQSSIKTKFEKDNSELAAALHESKMRLEDEAERLSHTEHMNEQYKIQIDELALQIKEDMSLQSKLNHRISELESVLQDQKPDKNNLRIKSDNPALSRSATDLLSLATPSPTKSGAVSGTPPGASATTTSSSRAFKFKSVLFGNKKSEHDKERERALQKIQDMEDEIKREKENSHSRKASTSTMASSIWSGQTRQSDYPSNASAGKINREGEYKSKKIRSNIYCLSLLVSAPPTQYEYNPSDPLRGFIKVPKQGKVKKGWKKVYAVVRDYKFFTYDKEKDADDIHAKPLDVIDLRWRKPGILWWMLSVNFSSKSLPLLPR